MTNIGQYIQQHWFHRPAARHAQAPTQSTLQRPTPPTQSPVATQVTAPPATAPVRRGEGKNINELAAEILRNYDHNGDGTISVGSGNENQRIDQAHDANGGHYTVVSINRLLARADADHSGSVTVDELRAVGRSYDTGGLFGINAGDGALDGWETLRAFGEVGEEIKFLAAGGINNGAGLGIIANEQGGFLALGNGQGGYVGLGNAQHGAAAWGSNGQVTGNTW